MVLLMPQVYFMPGGTLFLHPLILTAMLPPLLRKDDPGISLREVRDLDYC
jgi:hypothetical protein